MTTILTGDETAEDLERMTHEIAVPVPEGYTRVGCVAMPHGTFLVVTGEGLPAMGLTRDQTGDLTWIRAFNSGESVVSNSRLKSPLCSEEIRRGNTCTPPVVIAKSLVLIGIDRHRAI